MRSDIDKLMRETGHDALLVRGPTKDNPNMVYFTGRANMTFATLIKKRGEPPVLIHHAMERDEAAGTGLATKNLDAYEPMRRYEEAGGNEIEANAEILRRALEEFHVQGRVALYGRLESGPGYSIVRRMEELLPDIQFVGEAERASVLSLARATKEEAEVDRIRRMGQITVTVVEEIADFLTSQRAHGDKLIDKDDEPLTIGLIKRRIDLALARLGAANPEGTIFGMGHDSAVPHSVGRDSQPLRLGQAIVFDIFPCEPGGGYFYDFTRTWCLGYAPDEVQRVYEDVLGVYDALLPTLRAGAACRDIQLKACELFEAKGHPTVRTDPQTQQGYVHSLGHGLGLAVHEAPSFSQISANDDRLMPGSVVTLEPGLYYPERDTGIRLEDTVWIRPDGAPEVLAEYPKDLVLPVKGASF